MKYSSKSMFWSLQSARVVGDYGTHRFCAAEIGLASLQSNSSNGLNHHSANGANGHTFPGMIVDERNVSFFQFDQDEEELKVTETGDSAELCLGHKSSHGVAKANVSDGEIQNNTESQIHFEKVVRDGLKKCGKKRVGRPTMLLAFPETGHASIKRSLAVLSKGLKPRKVYLVSQPMAAAVGAGIVGNKDNANGCLVNDMGGGTVHVTYAWSKGISEQLKCLPAGGEYVNQSIANFFRKSKKIVGEKTFMENGEQRKIPVRICDLQLTIDPLEIEEIKRRIGSATMPDDLSDPKDNITMELSMHSGVEDEMVDIKISTADIQPYIEPTMQVISDGITQLLDIFKERGESAILRDVCRNGMVLVGGGAKLRNSDKHFRRTLNMEVKVLPEPEYVVIRGATKILQDPELLDKFAKEAKSFFRY